jgi:hypothetical protein
MNIETLIRETNPAPLSAIPGPDSFEARSTLLRLIEAPNPRRRPTVGRLTFAGIGAVAVVVAAVVVAVTVSSTTKAVPASAATVLVNAAGVAAAQPTLPALNPGQYYYEKTVYLQNCTFVEQGADAATGLVYLSPIASETWTTLDGSGSEQSAPQGPGHFQTSKEQAIWAASGQPNECIQTSSTRDVPPSTPDDPGITSLPADPTALGALIAAGRVSDIGQVSAGNGRCPSQNGDSKQVFAPGQVCNVAAQFDIVNNLLGAPEAPTKVGPVLYQILAQLPGVEIIGTQTDALGRSGTAIEDPNSGDVVVLDRTNGSLLETETLATTKTSSPGVPVGAVLQSTTFGAVGIVNASGVVPN